MSFTNSISRQAKQSKQKMTKTTKKKPTCVVYFHVPPCLEKTSYMLRRKNRQEKQARKKKTSCYKKKDPLCPNLPPIPKVSSTPYVRSCVCLCVSLLMPLHVLFSQLSQIKKALPTRMLDLLVFFWSAPSCSWFFSCRHGMRV